ncbi:tetratricopeptide repeat protein [Mucilaginibacter sabulilitoris]|uniref:Tetratricopeptide repeat protein n=1 Tax=Mucilaginibacter sabulilitoris TaxID=1173583 RepID=A0ABZ0TX80_9SPHI|nr:tetratricopeptide repeat protein [Mucilaginibacter sabulilitoris]WPU96758.1 tetratricopeptide repeat protein [Mucilaginibacter sabulilitoris]
MKAIVLSILLIVCLSINIKAQQLTTAADSLLLDYYQNQRFAEAADYLKKAYPEPVSNIRVLGKLAYTSQMAGRLPDAEGYYQRIYDTDSTNTTALFSLAGINLRRGNNTRAEVYYKIIAKKDSTNFLVYKQLGKIAGDKSDFGSMIYYLQKANKINPAEPDVASDLSDLYVNLKQYPAAEKALNGAIAQDPDNMILLQSLLKLVSSQDKFEETKSTCLKLMNLGNHSGYVLTKLGVAYYNLKNYACSVETFADIPGIEQSETSFYVSALAYKALKDQPKAILNLDNAIKAGISSNISDYYAEMADSYEVRKKYQKAVWAYQKALQFSEKPILYYLLASVYDTNLKNKKLALKYYKKYTASRPPEKQQKYVAYSKSRLDALAR